jgi:PAS domain S-box-containing protein
MYRVWLSERTGGMTFGKKNAKIENGMTVSGAKALSVFIANGDIKSGIFHEMMDAVPVAIYTTDAEGRLTYFNPAAAKLSGRTPELGTDKWCITWKIYLPDGTFLPPDQCPMAVALKGIDVPTGIECIAERPDGTRFWFTPCPAAIRDAEGRIVGGINILLDITDRARAERSALLLSAIVDSSEDAIISKDLNGVVTSWNNAAQRLFGYTAKEAIGKTVASLLIPDDRQDEESEIMARLRNGQRVDHFETVRRRKDGTLLDISLTISPVRDLRGNIIGASKIARDITESRRLRTALCESEARFRQLADSMPQIVWTALPDGQVDYYNERWYEFSGYSPNDFGDMSWEPILPPDEVQKTRDIYYGSIRSGEPYNYEHRLWDRREKRWRWFISRALAVRDAKGNIAKWFGTCTDIDEQKRAQEDLQRANTDLEQFAFTASHDLQEPLRSVKIYSDLLTREFAQNAGPDAQKYVRFIRAGATRMENLVRDLLAYTRIANDDKSPELSDANAALNTALANLAGAISEAHAEINAEPLPSSLPIHAAHLEQLFQNLVGNAIKYRDPDRTPDIRITAERKTAYWQFAISDNGIGIEAEHKESIFGLFKRLHSNDEYSGTGIGLAICQRIVDRHGGRIWTDSHPGVGSTFLFTIPV